MRTPASSYPRSRMGAARIETVDGDVTALFVGDVEWMRDDEAHWTETQRLAKEFSGHVLVAGLGLGLVVHALHANPAVTRITVVERDLQVIDIVRHHLPDRPKPVLWNADFWKTTVTGVDGIYFDLFVEDGPDVLSRAMQAAEHSRRVFGPDIKFRVPGLPDIL